MKKSNVISGAGQHQVSLSADERLAGSKRAQPPLVGALNPLPPRHKPSVPAAELKNSPLEPISEKTKVMTGPDLEARIKQLAQATGRLRAELESLAKSSVRKG
jgi:hypothetical protein